MSPNTLVRCLLAVSLLSAVACGRYQERQYQQVRYGSDESKDEQAEAKADGLAPAKATVDEAFVKLLKGAEKATLYEGLPHQRHEAALLKKEKASKKTVDFGDFIFYQEPLEVSDADFKALKTILSDAQTFRPYSGEKGCGGYHPDYFIEWYAEGEICRVYVCFGCGEAKLVGPNGETKYDLDSAGRIKLEDVLFAYHKNRPDSEGWLNLTKGYKERKQQ
jgi:hypothetical protein